MSYVATAIVRSGDGWTVSDCDLDGVTDIEEVADRLRDVDPQADVSLLFIEADDAYLVIMRLDQGEDLRVFGSDAAFARESRLGALLLGDLEPTTPSLGAGSGDEDEEGELVPQQPDLDPLGDADLLSDLGVSAPTLLSICARNGMLPSDMTAELAQALGCGDELEELRET